MKMDKETEILLRLASNHLLLAQLEPLRAILLTLRNKNSDLARIFLQTIVANAGRLDNILWTSNRSSPSLVAYLSAIELLQYDDCTSQTWSFSPGSLRLRVEFLLLIQLLSDRLKDSIENATEEIKSQRVKCFSVLEKVLEFSVKRLKANVEPNHRNERRVAVSAGSFFIEEEEMTGLKQVILNYPDVFDALCCNIDSQIKDRDGGDLRLAVVTGNDAGTNLDWVAEAEEDAKVLGAFQKCVQLAHINAIKESLSAIVVNEKVPSSSIRYLHLGHGVDDVKYRVVLQELVSMVLSKVDSYGSRNIAQKNLLLIYEGALSSNCSSLVKMIQDIQDDWLRQKIMISQELYINQFPFPFEQFHKYLVEVQSGGGGGTHGSSLSLHAAIGFCKRDLYHYARICGLNVLECVLEATLTAIKGEHLQEASQVLILFPQLRPLIAAMGWDLLHGKTLARRKLMQLVWKRSKLQGDSPLHYSKFDEVSSVEHLCDLLCFRLELANFVARVNSGQSWNSKSSLLSGSHHGPSAHEDITSDQFVENYVLERLSIQSPLHVLFDLVKVLRFHDAIELFNMSPISSAKEAWKRSQDIELMHMFYALESLVIVLGMIEKCVSSERESDHQLPFLHLKDLKNHLEAISNVPRKVMLINIIILILFLDQTLIECCSSPGNYSDLASTCDWKYSDAPTCGRTLETIVSFTQLLLDVLEINLPSGIVEWHSSNGGINRDGIQALEWKISKTRSFIEDWQWRVSVLQKLFPLYGKQLGWNFALTVLRAPPSKLLGLCLQKEQFDIGNEIARRFSLLAEDKAILELAKWVDDESKRTSKSKMDSNPFSLAFDGISTIHMIDVSSICSQLGSLATICLLIDVAATSANMKSISKQLLDQASVVLSEIYPEVLPKIGSLYWEQIHEVGLVSILQRILKHLHELLLEDDGYCVQSYLVGDHIFAGNAFLHHSKGERTLPMLHQMIDDANMGKRQFLSGKLHNLSRAIAEEEVDMGSVKDDYGIASFMHYTDVVLGLGLKAAKPITVDSDDGDASSQTVDFDPVLDEERAFSLGMKPGNFLSQFILHIAAIGDIVDGADTTHDFNFFSIVYEWPKDILVRLAFDSGNFDAAEKVAEIMHVDIIHEITSACVPPVLPPRSNHGWASIPVSSYYINPCSEISVSSFSEMKKASTHFSPNENAPRYSLKMDIVKHLVNVSPVRGVLACVFGGGILYNNCISSHSFNDLVLPTSDSDQLFYEFALDQSERFPTLNRWIQMQTVARQVSQFAITAEKVAGKRNDMGSTHSSMKRPREHDLDDEAGIVDSGNLANISANCYVPESARATVPERVCLSLDWEIEELYESLVDQLIGEGKFVDALALSDRFLHNGASDHLLRLLVEHEEENHHVSELSPGGDGNVMQNTSWKYCLRFKNKHLAARLTLKYIYKWDLDVALEVLTMCASHYIENDTIFNEILRMRQALQKYKRILSADDQHSSWQEVESACNVDPEGLALRLAGKGAVTVALEVAEDAGLSVELQRELRSRQLVKLLTTDPLIGGGPVEASRFLSSLPDPDDVLPVATLAMQLLSDLRSKQLLVHFLLKRKGGSLADADVSRLNSWALGFHVLDALPLPWQQRCLHLHEHPHLILEVLLMRKQLQSAALILKEFPSLRDESVIVAYASKSITAKFETQFRNVFPCIQNHSAEENTRDDVKRKRLLGSVPPERVAWEEPIGIPEGQVSSPSACTQTRFSTASILEEWMLTGDANKDEAVRLSHRYESAPDIALFKALLSFCSDEATSAKNALDLCVKQMKDVLNSQQLPESASVETIGQACRVAETVVQGLLYAKSLLPTCSSDRTKDTEAFSLSSKKNSPETSDIWSQIDLWLGRAKLLKNLLGSGISVSIDDISNAPSSTCLRDRLIVDERYSLALYTCKKCKIDVFPVLNAWGHALIRMEHYAQAHMKFKQALRLYTGDPSHVILEIINAIEEYPTTDISSIRSMHEHLAKSSATMLDDSLSADSYLNILNMPSTSPWSERSRHSEESLADITVCNSDSDAMLPTNLDAFRYAECVNYLQEYARQHLLEFMFRHGRYVDACMLFFPANGIPSLPSIARETSSQQRHDPLLTDYGTIDDLCGLCINYGAMSTLEEVLVTRLSSANPQDVTIKQHATAFLCRVCTYCESHRHFNYFYRFQVIRKDYVTAGLCCIQLFVGSSSQEEAVKHLEHAKMHFDEGLSAQYRDRGPTRLVTKNARGKTASEKLTEGLVKFSARVSIQVQIVKSFNNFDGPQWKHSLFGNPNDKETFRRRCEVAEKLLEKNFDLAFQVIHEFDLPAVDIYAVAAASLADGKGGSQLAKLFKNIKGTVGDDDWDQVLGSAINIYASKHIERPDRLIEMLTSNHRKVLACVLCGRLKIAFQIASRSGSVADVQYVAHQALHANALPVLHMCRQWLAQYM